MQVFLQVLDDTSTSYTDTQDASNFLRSTSNTSHYNEDNPNLGTLNASTFNINTPNKNTYYTPCPKTSSLYASTTGTSTSPCASIIRISTFGTCTIDRSNLVSATPVPIKDVSKVVIPKYFVNLNKVVTHKNLILTHLPNKVPHHDIPELSTNRFATYHSQYKKILEMTECA